MYNVQRTRQTKHVHVHVAVVMHKYKYGEDHGYDMYSTSIMPGGMVNLYTTVNIVRIFDACTNQTLVPIRLLTLLNNHMM